MTGAERNSFERELQKDPFSEEAADGFGCLSESEAIKDVSILQKRLRTRVLRRQRFIYYRIAASIAILMVISSIFIIVEQNKSTKQTDIAYIDKRPLEIVINQPITGQSAETVMQKIPEDITNRKAVISAGKQIKMEAGKGAIPVEKMETASVHISDSIRDFRIITAQEPVKDELLAPPAAVRIKGKASSLFLAKGKVLSSEDKMPVPGVNITIKGTTTGVVTDAGGNFKINLPDSEKRTLVANFIGMETKEFVLKADSSVQLSLDPAVSALSEVVVVGYGSKRAETETEVLQSGYYPPQPVNGKTNFDKYIQENIMRPDSANSAQRVVVVLSFYVRTNGSLDSIRVVRSPGKLFSDEAIRLIKGGPGWKPAEENGKIIEDEVRVRIVFR